MRPLDWMLVAWMNLTWVLCLYTLRQTSKPVKIDAVTLNRVDIEPSSDDEDFSDEMALRALAGARFGPGASVTLPSGRKLTGAEAQALTSFYADDAEERS